MARNWRDEDERGYDRARGEDRGYGRGTGENRGRGSYGDPRRMSGSQSYGSDFGASDPRASWSGMDESDYRRRWQDDDDRHGGRDRFPSYDPGSRLGQEGFGAGRYDAAYDDDRVARGGGRSPYGNRNWSGGRGDWGRQEWGMSGPQQGGYGSERSHERGYGRNHDRSYDREDRGFWDRASDEVASWFGDEEAERRRHQDQYRGKGPKNYSRSDDRIREDISDRLTDDWQVDASEIEITVVKGEVTLAGSVSDRMQRRRAEDIAESVSGAHHVQNNLRVKGGASYGASTSGETRTDETRTAITPAQASTISSRNT